ELLSAVHSLYPDGQWKQGVSLSKLTRYLMDQAAIHLPVEIPPASHHLRTIRAIARCFDILKDSPTNLIESARNGDRNVVLGLVKVDTLFLHDSCTRGVVTEAQRRENHEFLKQLSAALRYKPKARKKVICRCVLYMLFASGYELPKYSELQRWFDPNG